MNFLISAVLLTTVAVGEVLSSQYHGSTALPTVLHNGYLADTHEVAAARSAHLATLSHQSHGGSHGHQGVPSHYTHDRHHEDSRYHGPIAIPHVLHDGHIADTHEVAAAKAEHYAAVAKARAHGGYHHGGDHGAQYASGYDHYSGASGAHQGQDTHSAYHGRLAIPHVLHDGHIADTHEVAAAKAEHYAAVAKARAHGGYHHGGDYNGQYASGYDHYSGASGAHHGYSTNAAYHGQLAKPVVLPSGYLADTHDVTVAKQHHLHLLHSSKEEFHSVH